MGTWRDLIEDALIEIGAQAPGEPLPAEHLEMGRRRLNRIIDEWAARKVYAYNVAFREFTLSPNHQPHLIGPGLAAPDFDAARPVRIENAAIILVGTQPVDVPLNIRDDDWWANQRVKSVASTVPTDLYYSPDMPNGGLYLWPVPTFAYGLRLETWVCLIGVAAENVTDDFVAAPAYERTLLLALAKDLGRPFGIEAPASLEADLRAARAALQSGNDKSPRTQTADYGTRGRRGGGFNYYSGGPR